MSFELLRIAVKQAADDPAAILQALQAPWAGALNRAPYTSLLVYCATCKSPKVEQIKMLGLLGADVGEISSPGLALKSAPEVLDPAQQIAAQRRAARATTTGLTDPVKIHAAVLQKFRGQLTNDAAVNGASSLERVSFKGRLIAHLENAGQAAAALPSMKRSLVLDAGAHQAGYAVDVLDAALTALVAGDPNSFFWCSLVGSVSHAVDVVVRATGAGFEMTSCNRGEGAFVEPSSGKAGALRATWPSARALADKLAPWTKPSNQDSMHRYNFDLHRVPVGAKDTAKPGAPDYRPQKLQKEGNCATKSMFAALSYLTAKDQDELEAYRGFRRSLDAGLSKDQQRIGAQYVPKTPGLPAAQ